MISNALPCSQSPTRATCLPCPSLGNPAPAASARRVDPLPWTGQFTPRRGEPHSSPVWPVTLRKSGQGNGFNVNKAMVSSATMQPAQGLGQRIPLPWQSPHKNP